jgi:hypothetical protein
MDIHKSGECIAAREAAASPASYWERFDYSAEGRHSKTTV